MRERKCWWMVGRKRKKERTGFFPACQSARKDQRKVAEVRTLRCGEGGRRKMKLGEIWTAKEKRIQQGCKCAVHESFACLPGSGGSCVFFRGRESWRGRSVLGQKERKIEGPSSFICMTGSSLALFGGGFDLSRAQLFFFRFLVFR